MAKGLPFDGVIMIAVVFVVIVCATVAGQEEEEEGTGPYDSLMVSIRWPKSVCTAANKRVDSFNCKQPMIRYPTLNGIWLMHKLTYPAPSYDENHECSQIEPLDHITYDIIAPIARNMTNYWPDLIYNTRATNLQLWDTQWGNYGQCFLDNQNPIPFFQVGLDIIVYNDILDILKKGDVKPDNRYYKGRMISTALFMHFHVRIAICCSENKDGVIQLDNIRICLNWNANSLLSCPYAFLHCPDGEDQMINFPAP